MEEVTLTQAASPVHQMSGCSALLDPRLTLRPQASLLRRQHHSWRYLHLGGINDQSPENAYDINQNGLEIGGTYLC